MVTTCGTRRPSKPDITGRKVAVAYHKLSRLVLMWWCGRPNARTCRIALVRRRSPTSSPTSPRRSCAPCSSSCGPAYRRAPGRSIPSHPGAAARDPEREGPVIPLVHALRDLERADVPVADHAEAAGKSRTTLRCLALTATSWHVRWDEAGDGAGHRGRIVDRDPRPGPRDGNERGAGEIGREPLGVRYREEAALLAPDQQDRPVEARDLPRGVHEELRAEARHGGDEVAGYPPVAQRRSRHGFHALRVQLGRG